MQSYLKIVILYFILYMLPLKDGPGEKWYVLFLQIYSFTRLYFPQIFILMKANIYWALTAYQTLFQGL